MKRILAIMTAMTLLLALAGCGGSSPAAGKPSEDGAYAGLAPVVLIGCDTASKGAAGQRFGEYVAERLDEITGGKLTMDYHPNGELGGDADLIRQMRSNDIQIVVCQTAPLVSFIPEMAVFDLPMVFANYDGDAINEALNGENAFTEALGAAYEAQGLHLLGSRSTRLPTLTACGSARWRTRTTLRSGRRSARSRSRWHGARSTSP